jgi:putative ABC transport system permease protein
MRWPGKIWLRFRSLFRRRAADGELADELRFHLERAVERNLARGMTPEEARRRALLELGGVEQVKEECRDARGWNFLDDTWRDVCYAARMLRNSPGFTLVAVLTLALGIGVNTAIFSLVDSLFMLPLPVANSSRLVDVYGTRAGRPNGFFSYPDYAYFAEHVRTISNLAAQYPTAPINLVISRTSHQINGSVVSCNYFPLLKLTPALGRFFLPEEDKVPGRDPVAVISYGLWQGEFAGDRNILGKSVILNGTPFTIVGVAPRGFQGAAFGVAATDVWIPAAMFHTGYRYCDVFQRGCTVLTLIGELKAGQTVADAQAEMSVLARQLEAAYPKTNMDVGAAVVPARGVRPDLLKQRTGSAMLLAAMVALVMLIACANLAGLLLSRGVARQKEMAMRLALGASRMRLIRQLLTESLLLSSLGGGLGLLVALWFQDVLLNFYATSSEGAPQYFTLSLNSAVLFFTLGVSLLAGVAFGLAPARRTSRTDCTAAMKDEGASSGPRRSRLRGALVVSQVAISLMLLICSGLLVRSLANVYRGAGFDPSHLFWLRLRPSLVGYDATKAWTYQREVIRKIEALPGVQSASPEDFSPLRQSGHDARVWLPARAPARAALGFPVSLNLVGPRYFETLGVPLLRGREFGEQDRQGSPQVAILNETLAHHFWPGTSAVGKVLVVDGDTYQVVGVVKDAQYYDVSREPPPFLYTDYWQQDMSGPWGEDSRTLVRVAGDPRAMLPLIRKEIETVDPKVPISEDRPFRDWLADEFQPVRMAGTFVIGFGALALFLCAIGLHGILAFTVSRRTREIGIRMALGAERGEVARMILRQGTGLALLGAGIGIAAAFASARLLASFLYGVRPYDPATFIVAPVVMIGVALLASYLPTRRAMRVDPMTALRHE